MKDLKLVAWCLGMVGLLSVQAGADITLVSNFNDDVQTLAPGQSHKFGDLTWTSDTATWSTSTGGLRADANNTVADRKISTSFDVTPSFDLSVDYKTQNPGGGYNMKGYIYVTDSEDNGYALAISDGATFGGSNYCMRLYRITAGAIASIVTSGCTFTSDTGIYEPIEFQYDSETLAMKVWKNGNLEINYSVTLPSGFEGFSKVTLSGVTAYSVAEGTYFDNFSMTIVPEPLTAAIVITGIGFVLMRRKK